MDDPFYLSKHSSLQAFFSASNDHSPKGTIDFPIRELCRTVNLHPDYYTLSTCSGRISLFESESTNADSTTDATNGKGSGRWLLSTHSTVTLPNLKAAIKTSSPTNTATGRTSTLLFKHEPALLHISCRTPIAAEHLLKAALGSGFRESGLTTSSHKSQSMLAIRGMGLSLATPIYADLLSTPETDTWLERLLSLYNDKFRANEQRLIRLQRNIELLLQPKAPVSKRAKRGGKWRASSNPTRA